MKRARIDRRRLTVTICGTFNLGLPEVADAVEAFWSAGATVLSPADPTETDCVGGFVFVKSDRHRDPRLVERRHLQSIAESDLLWLVAPGGYVGISAAAEVAYAAGRGIATYTADRVSEPAIAALTIHVPSPGVALRRAEPPSQAGVPSLLVDPDTAAEQACNSVRLICSRLTTAETVDGTHDVGVAARQLRQAVAGL